MPQLNNEQARKRVEAFLKGLDALEKASGVHLSHLDRSLYCKVPDAELRVWYFTYSEKAKGYCITRKGRRG